jgi:hypothetical protein
MKNFMSFARILLHGNPQTENLLSIPNSREILEWRQPSRGIFLRFTQVKFQFQATEPELLRMQSKQVD